MSKEQETPGPEGRRDSYDSFDAWWHSYGRFIQPEVSDVPFWDQREKLCRIAWSAARQSPCIHEIAIAWANDTVPS